MQIPQSAMDEDKWLSLAAFEVMERGAIGLEGAGCRVTYCLSSGRPGDRPTASSEISVRLMTEGVPAIEP